MSESDRKVVFPRVEIHWLSGNCPVQAEGVIATARHGTCPFYFRARGTSISVDMTLADGRERMWEIRYGHQYDAGWIVPEFARGCIHEAARWFDQFEDDLTVLRTSPRS